MTRLMLMLLLGSQGAFAISEPPLPSWDAEDRNRKIGEGWFAGGWLMTYEALPPEESADEIPLFVEEPPPDEIAASPEDENEVSEEYLADYFAEKPDGHLVDPQKLLSERERKDLGVLLNYHAGDSSIEMYVYVFGTEQQIPGDVREEELVERLYSLGKPAMVVYYYLGAPQRSAVYLSPVITDSVSAAEQRRALESSVMLALGNSKPFDQVEAFLEQMSIRIYWMERIADGTADETMEEIPDGENARAFDRKVTPVEMPIKIPAWTRLAGVVFAAACGGILSLWILVVWWRGRVRYRFPEFDVEPRLGGSHAAGIGAVISFASPAIPPAMQRNQMPDYMRRA